jgi:hypothetical protein
VHAENDHMPRKEIFCENCDSYQPLEEYEPQTDDRNPYPWYDLQCATCHLIIATLQVVPDDKPVEPSAAVTDTSVQPLM